VDALGRPVHIHLSPGNRNDQSEASRLIEHAHGKYFVADRAYDTERVLKAVRAKGMKPVIPSASRRRVPRLLDRRLYRRRHRIENFFCQIKRYRRVATRYDKAAPNFLGFVLFAAIRVWLA
jgi:transposase